MKMTDQHQAKLKQLIDANGIVCSEPALQKLIAFTELLMQWNKKFNLTAIRDIEEVITHHLIDSLVIQKFIKEPLVLDAGCGPGFPCVPLAITNPEQQFLALDSNGKKIRFIHHVLANLTISNVKPLQQRLESFSDSPTPAAIVTRAFTDLNNMVNWSAHLLQQGSILYAMKGAYPQAELDELQAQSNHYQTEVMVLDVVGIDAQRHLVQIALKS